MLRIVQGPITYCGDNFPNDKQGVTIKIVRSSSSHDDSAAHMESSQYNRKQRTTPFIDAEPDTNTEESIDLWG